MGNCCITDMYNHVDGGKAYYIRACEYCKSSAKYIQDNIALSGRKAEERFEFLRNDRLLKLIPSNPNFSRDKDRLDGYTYGAPIKVREGKAWVIKQAIRHFETDQFINFA